MVKIGKEYSDAFGFKLLGHYTGFVKEYPVEGAKIQKICDDGFLEACKKSYPVILSTGIDPATYRPKDVATFNVRDELRKMFPVKQQVVVVEDESTSSCEEDEEEDTACSPSNSPRLVKPKVKKIEIGSKCATCLFKTKENDDLRKLVESLKNEKLKLEEEVKKLTDELNEEKKKSTYRLALYTNLMKDPDYQQFNEFKQFETFKRKRQ